jgi:tRNA threonylcarbamoyladenosine biosynthesis protein TsaE
VKQTAISISPEQTRELGSTLATNLAGGETLILTGDLGSGKTEFVKGLAGQLHCTTQVTSPTFTLVHEYRDGRLPLFHMDFYRLQSESELDELALDNYFRGDSVCAIEWGEKFAYRLPVNSIIQVSFTIAADQSRQIGWRLVDCR